MDQARFGEEHAMHGIVKNGEDGGRRKRRRVKIRVFHAKERIYNLHISLSELVLLSGSPLLAKREFSCLVQFLLGWDLG